MKSIVVFSFGMVFIFIAMSMPLVGQFMNHHGGDYLQSANMLDYDELTTGRDSEGHKQTQHVVVGSYNMVVILTCVFWGIGFAVVGGILVYKGCQEGL